MPLSEGKAQLARVVTSHSPGTLRLALPFGTADVAMPNGATIPKPGTVVTVTRTSNGEVHIAPRIANTPAADPAPPARPAVNASSANTLLTFDVTARALGHQKGLAPVFAMSSAIVTGTATGLAQSLPPAVRQAMAAVADLVLDPSDVSNADKLRQTLVKLGHPSGSVAMATQPSEVAMTNLLKALIGALREAAHDTVELKPHSLVLPTDEEAPPPPQRGNGPMSEPPATARGLERSLSANPNQTLLLLAQATHGAVARLMLNKSVNQAAAAKPTTTAENQAQLQLPVVLNGILSMIELHLECDRASVEDERSSGKPALKAEPSWRVGLAADLPQVGPVHARICLDRDATRLDVRIFVERAAEAKRASDEAERLCASLRSAGFSSADVLVRQGRPSDPATRQGTYLDISS